LASRILLQLTENNTLFLKGTDRDNLGLVMRQGLKIPRSEFLSLIDAQAENKKLSTQFRQLVHNRGTAMTIYGLFKHQPFQDDPRCGFSLFAGWNFVLGGVSDRPVFKAVKAGRSPRVSS
jgi:hypothetical protein